MPQVTPKASLEYRVPYADTDQMGFVYYANFFVYFERSRNEILRDLGIPYVELEERGELNLVYQYEISESATIKARVENMFDAEVEYTQCCCSCSSSFVQEGPIWFRNDSEL